MQIDVPKATAKLIMWASIAVPYIVAMNRIDDLGIQLLLTGCYVVAVVSIMRLVIRRPA
jgi:hypothetical protein